MGSSIFNEVQLLKGNLITMELLKPKINDYPGQHIKLKIDNAGLDFGEAKDFAKQKAEETGADPVLPWYQDSSIGSAPVASALCFAKSFASAKSRSGLSILSLMSLPG